MILPTLVLSLAARLALAALASSPTERLVCLLGRVDAGTIVVDSIVANDDPDATSAMTVARGPCPEGTIGRAHSHPGAVNCWYTFPGTIVPTADLVSFRRGGYPMDAIVCGALLVWIAQDGTVAVEPLTEGASQ